MITKYHHLSAAFLSFLAVYAHPGMCKAQEITPCAFGSAPGARSIPYLIADLKTSFREHHLYSQASALAETNYRTVLDGLRHKIGFNGIRLPIFPQYDSGSQYSQIYQAVYQEARRLGFLIYASPESVGMKAYKGWNEEQYVNWLANYTKTFRPDVLSPFNESGLGNSRMALIVGRLRSQISSGVRLAGPDRVHLDTTLEALAKGPEGSAGFDIVDSHNASSDTSATANGWSSLVALAGGRPVWSSENPALWDRGRHPGLPGLNQPVQAGVQGIVIWQAEPLAIDNSGQPTAEGCELAKHVVASQ